MDSLLREILDSLEFEDNGWIRVHSYVWDDEAINLTFEINTGIAPDDRQLWTVRCSNVSSYQLAQDLAYDIEIAEKHVLLLPHTSPSSELFFSGAAGNPSEVIGKLWLVHEHECGQWIPFRRYLNRQVPLNDLLTASSGCLAKGPKPLLERYASVLVDCGLKPSVVGEHEPKRWVANRWAPEPTGLRVMIVEGTYIVAQDFVFSRTSA